MAILAVISFNFKFTLFNHTPDNCLVPSLAKIGSNPLDINPTMNWCSMDISSLTLNFPGSVIHINHILPHFISFHLQVNLDMTDSMGPGKLVRRMQNLLYTGTYDEHLICIGLGPSISSVICKNPSYNGTSYPSSSVFKDWYIKKKRNKDNLDSALNNCSMRNGWFFLGAEISHLWYLIDITKICISFLWIFEDNDVHSLLTLLFLLTLQNCSFNNNFSQNWIKMGGRHLLTLHNYY